MRELHKRKWLNSIKSNNTGSIHYHASRDKDLCISASFSVRDCNRKITLDFDVYSPADVERVLAKVDTLFDSVKEFREHLYRVNGKEVV